jgi:hypothetical protein
MSRVLLLALVLAVPARAATMWFLPDAKLCSMAEVIVVGRVLSAAPELAPGRTLVQTRVRFAVTEYVKLPRASASKPPELEIITVGGIEPRRPGAARFTPGEKALVFLAPGDDAYRVLGLARGKYHVDAAAPGEPETVRLDLEGLTQLDPETGHEIPADLIPAASGRVYLDDLVATLRRTLSR